MNLPFEELINDRKSTAELQFKLYAISAYTGISYTKTLAQLYILL